ncbi:hypothetical protein [Cupriavidus campinensis]
MGVITKRITKAGPPSYQAKCRRKGFPVVSKTFTLLADAKAFVREIERAFDLGELPDDLKPAARAKPAASPEFSTSSRTYWSAIETRRARSRRRASSPP